MTDLARRPLRTRNSGWANGMASWLAASGISPNQISIASIVFAALAGGAFFLAGRLSTAAGITVAYFAAIVGIQGRLLCNLFDGMVAVEGGRKTKSGELFNELPDRISDVFIFVGAGFSAPHHAWLPHLGWGAAVVSLIVAYVRALGASAGAGQCYLGPMAKPHRMALMTAASLAAAFACPWHFDRDVVATALVVVIVGGLVTIVRRTRVIIRTLEES